MTTPAEAVDSPTTRRRLGRPGAALPPRRGWSGCAGPRQWIKNLLVFAAPAAAGVLFHGTRPLARVPAAFGVFCLAASGTYFVNDAIDADVRPAPPLKRLRPVAAGVVPVPPGRGGGRWSSWPPPSVSAGLLAGLAPGPGHRRLRRWSTSPTRWGSSTSPSSTWPRSRRVRAAGRSPAAWPPAWPCPTGSSSWPRSARCSS